MTTKKSSIFRNFKPDVQQLLDSRLFLIQPLTVPFALLFQYLIEEYGWRKSAI